MIELVFEVLTEVGSTSDKTCCAVIPFKGARARGERNIFVARALGHKAGTLGVVALELVDHKSFEAVSWSQLW